MNTAPRRKWLPAEAYRYLVLSALSSRGGQGVSKRALAWETRANHYMITRVLSELHQAGLVAIESGPRGHLVTATSKGRGFVAQHGAYVRASFGDLLEAHFRFGRRPAWVTESKTSSAPS